MPESSRREMDILSFGIYESLLDEELREKLTRYPELRAVLGKIDTEEQPTRYSAFVAKAIEHALKQENDPVARLDICNRLIDLLSDVPERAHLGKHRLVSTDKSVLLEITPPHYNRQGLPRPETPLVESSLFTGAPQDPQLIRELHEEMLTADSVDILVSFIKWSGLRLLMPAFDDLLTRRIPVRVITTSYMGASDAPAVEWLARQPNIEVKVSYDANRTRLHAKAYHFVRNSGFSTAYIGSANMSHAAMTSGLEWTLKVTAQDMPHIIEKFIAEFETYWISREFISLDPDNPHPFRIALDHGKRQQTPIPTTFFDIRPHPFQERILDALYSERNIHNH